MAREQHPNSLANLKSNPKWVPGCQATNPRGREPNLPEELKDCTPQELRLKIWRVWKRPQGELEAIIANPSTEAGVAWLASVYTKGIKTGDQARLDMLLNRLVGKVKEVVEVHTGDPTPSLQDAKAIIDADFTQLPAATVVVEEL